MTNPLTPADLDAIRVRVKARDYALTGNDLKCAIAEMNAHARYDIATLLLHADQQQARSDILAAALYPLVHKDTPRDGVDYACMDKTRCRHCGETLYWKDVNEHGETIYTGHADDCAWIVARDALKGGE